jgi:hypothetical protein
MKIDVSKIDSVIIIDEDGNIVDRFELGVVGVTTMRDKSKVLELKKAKKSLQE